MVLDHLAIYPVTSPIQTVTHDCHPNSSPLCQCPIPYPWFSLRCPNMIVQNAEDDAVDETDTRQKSNGGQKEMQHKTVSSKIEGKFTGDIILKKGKSGFNLYSSLILLVNSCLAQD